MRLVLAGCIVPTHQNLKVYIVYINLYSLTGFSHMFSPDGLNNTLLSQGCVLVTAPTVGTVYRVYIPGTGKG